jgi:hypothetical protein
MLLCLAAPLCAQVPAPNPTPAAPTTPAALTPAQSPPQQAKISFLGDQLGIQADNSSLNQILRQVAQITGITISGSVSEERVFGSYGPGKPSEVLAQLLDGTASNMLFLASTGNKPSELVLTPRTGGPVPTPSPASMRAQNNDDEQSARPVYPPPPSDSTEQPEQAERPEPATPPPAAAPAADQQSPTAKTPQQIYDQLMKLRQQQQQSR